MPHRAEHIIVCGVDRLSRRTLERVRSAGRTAVAIVPYGSHHRGAGVVAGDVVAGDPQAPATRDTSPSRR